MGKTEVLARVKLGLGKVHLGIRDPPGHHFPNNPLSPSWLARTDPKDVARVESKTVIVTPSQRDTVPLPAGGARGQLGNWMSPAEFQQAVDERFPGCMQGNQSSDTEAGTLMVLTGDISFTFIQVTFSSTGRTMYVLPFSMGPVGSPLSRIGVQLTDSAYVVASMRIMTRLGTPVLQALGDGDFVKCLHSVGRPLTRPGEFLLCPLEDAEACLYSRKNPKSYPSSSVRHLIPQIQASSLGWE